MKRIIFSILLCGLFSGCSISVFGPPKVEDYKGSDYAILSLKEDGSLTILRTYELQNGCYKKIKSETLVEATFNRPEVIRYTEHKIKGGGYYALVYIYTTSLAGRQFQNELLQTLIPVAGHNYNESRVDLTTKTPIQTWPLDQRCRGLI